MIIYSQTIIEFILDIKRTLKKILVQEARLKVRGDRFYNRQETHSYPIKIIIYNDQSKLGFFDPNFYELGFHKSILHCSKKNLNNLIRHELAHYLTFIRYSNIDHPHGKEFRAICKEYDWGKEVYAATMEIEEKPLVENEAIIRKVQKLMSLGSSSNSHEATSAILKSRELLLKHNLRFTKKDEDLVFLKRIIRQKRKNAKMEAIAHILETFFVSTVYHHGKGSISLEILGNKVNIEIATYIADILDLELENLWKRSNLKGLAAKNSFFHGIAMGYCDKAELLNQMHLHDKALMIIEQKLERAKQMVYPRLSSSRSGRKLCKKAALLGKDAGKNLSFKKGIYADNPTTNLLK